MVAPSAATAVEPTSTAMGRSPSRRGRRLLPIGRPIVNLLLGQSVLLLNAGWLTFGSVASAALGFFYWLLAARTFPPEAVGYAAGALALMSFVGQLGEIGLGPLLMGNVLQSDKRLESIIPAALLMTFAASSICAICVLVLSKFFTVSLGGLFDGYGAVIFTFACGLSGLSLVLDQTLAGLLRSELAASRNLVLGTTKLVLLAGLPLVLSGNKMNEVVLFATWFVGQIAGVISLAAAKDRRLIVGAVFGRPDLGFFHSRMGVLLRHHGLTVAGMGAMLLPFVVTIELTPETNAAFNAAWTLTNVALLAPLALSLGVFAVGSKDPSGLAHQLRAALGVSLAVAIAVALICYFGSFFILSLFSPDYARVASTSFKLLSLGIFPVAIKDHYMATQRIRDRMASASLIVAIGSALELLGAVLGGHYGGLVGLTVGWLVGLGCTSVLMAQVVIEALFPIPAKRG